MVVTDRNVLPREYSRYQAASFHHSVSDHLAFVCDCVVTSHCRLQWREHSPVTLNYWRMVFLSRGPILTPLHSVLPSLHKTPLFGITSHLPAPLLMRWFVTTSSLLRSSYRFGDGKCSGLFCTSNLLDVGWQLWQWRDNSSWRWRV